MTHSGPSCGFIPHALALELLEDWRHPNSKQQPSAGLSLSTQLLRNEANAERLVPVCAQAQFYRVAQDPCSGENEMLSVNNSICWGIKSTDFMFSKTKTNLKEAFEGQ